MILFELRSRDNTSNNVSFDEKDEDNNITYYRAYTIHIYLYGRDSSDIANKISARFRTEDIRVKAYTQGLFIEEVTDPVLTSEFVNESMWLRNDIDIDIDVKFTIENNSIYYQQYNKLSKLEIKEKNK